MALILLTAARAQRAAHQYFGPSKQGPTGAMGCYEFHSKSEDRILRIWQSELGTVTFEEFHLVEGTRLSVYKSTYALPAIGPINFNESL